MSKCFAPEGVTSALWLLSGGWFLTVSKTVGSQGHTFCVKGILPPPSAQQKKLKQTGMAVARIVAVCWAFSLKTTSIHPNAVAPSMVKPRSSSHLLSVFHTEVQLRVRAQHVWRELRSLLPRLPPAGLDGGNLQHQAHLRE